MSVQNGVCGNQQPSLKTTFTFYNPYEISQREKMLLTGEHADVEFDVGLKQRKTYKAHKLILSGGCPKFNKMFELHGSNNTPIRIPEIEPYMFDQLLR